MKNKISLLFIFCSLLGFSQVKDSTEVTYKKRVLESIEVDYLMSYYKQNGIHSAVSGGIGSEKLTDLTSNIVVAMPLNDDDVLTIDAGISAYTSASSSNINPFNASGASGGGGGDDDDRVAAGPSGTPWQASSGASAQDVYASVVANYSHSSDDRTLVWNADVAFSNEYDYTSIGFGGGIAKLFNDKNSEVSLKVNAYLDQWRPIYPTELHEYASYGSGFQSNGYFSGVTILDQNGNASTAYLPSAYKNWESTNRNSYSASFGFSQVATKKLQFSVFFDVLSQTGMLSTPYQRVYFSDKDNYYIGEAQYITYPISIYQTSQNQGVYQLADDIERLPGTRFKIPVGARLNYYLNERVTLRSYYRYYWDDWGVTSHTASIELPVKLSDKFTIYPSYRFYTQGKAKYFAPFDEHLSTEKYYTSDYDLSTFNANQYGFGVGYTDIFTNAKIWKFGLKNIDFRYSHYDRNDGLNANIVSFGIKFVEQ
ncbi:DUF3570 domain-containing protein [Flavobacterium sp.]|jgi:hypothetical protein|uniref:DUF3570 domain-containing protein n=1 Tax=Flavobacterium sp. TaxID=239 RepID=UPI0037BE29FA